MESAMFAACLSDGRLYELLQRFDEDLAAEQRAGGCPRCGGVLHSASYPRKPRGAAGLAPEYGWRLSFCCAREGCRKRATPPSLRFLGRKVYLGAVVVLVSALRCGVTPMRMHYLEEWVGVSRRTVMRWRRWWCEHFVATAFWRANSSRLMPPLAHAQLPAALLERFAGAGRERLISALRWISPLTTESAAMHAI
jgi:hypothetical protein